MPMIAQIPKPVSGGMILSYKCSAECRHCIYAYSQRWLADVITVNTHSQDHSRLATFANYRYHFQSFYKEGALSAESYLNEC